MTLALISTQPAVAAGIEALVMPGKVVASHADIETECSSCHQAFSQSAQRALCLNCHEEVAADLERTAGFHGLFPDVAEQTCAACHTDHEGRNADIVQLDAGAFDHEFTDFPLQGKHAEAACNTCHAVAAKHRDAPGDCLACHDDESVHEDLSGVACTDCHSATDWQEIAFDHDSTGYLLLGGHLITGCLDCHEVESFQGVPNTCYDCHAADDVHNGRSGQECERCHSPTSWTETSFDHQRDTRFPLQGSHEELSCGDCHGNDPFADQLQTECVACHIEDDDHDGHFGDQCETCHASNAWADATFDHEADTEYALHGAHAAIECEACHIEPIFEVPLQSKCNDCHADDDAHEGQQGAACADCHNEQSWQDEVFFDHDLTPFPLLGSHAGEECAACHESHAFRDAPTACVGCHLDEDPHGGRYDDDCGACHNPVDWGEWRFDHNSQTDFLLDGAHITVTCEGCHRQSLAAMHKLGGRCGDCHRADDVHDGEFGFDCARCHSADSFRDVRSIR